jgi:hypothetical protein
MGRRSTALGVTAAPIVCLLLGALVATATGSSRSDAVKRCQVLGTTITANEFVRVYRRGNRDAFTAYACVARTGKVRKLGDFGMDHEGEGLSGFALNGTYVAYDDLLCPGEECFAQVRVVNVRTGTARSAPKEVKLGSAAEGLAVTSNGAVVWLRGLNDRWDVHKFDAAGPAVLDSTPPGTVVALALAGNTAYWLNNGTPHTATLK